jgi:hypothetical protein
MKMETEITPAEHTDHPNCLRCHKPLKNSKWRKLGYGAKCYAKHCQETQQTLGEAEPEDADSFHRHNNAVPENQERAPDPKIQRGEKRAALDRAIQEEMARKDPEPTEVQRKAAEARLLTDVDKALGLEEDPEPEETKKKVSKKKAPKGRAVVKPGAFNRGARSMIVNGRDN